MCVCGGGGWVGVETVVCIPCARLRACLRVNVTVRTVHARGQKTHPLGLPWDDAGWLAQTSARLPSQLQELENAPIKLLYVRGNHDSFRFFSPQFLALSNGAIFRYNTELWKAPCEVARLLAPYAATHVRGSDGKFKRRMIAGSSLPWNEPQVAQLRRLFPAHVASASPTSASGEARKPAASLLVITDLHSTAHVWNKVLQKQPWVGLLANRTDDLLVTSTIDDGAENENDRYIAGTLRAANSAFKQKLHWAVGHIGNQLQAMNYPPLAPEAGQIAFKIVAKMLLDIMLAALADLGFAGQGESSFSKHINAVRGGLGAPAAGVCKLPISRVYS